MAEKLNGDGVPATGAISPNDFTSIFGELIAATIGKDKSVGKMRAIRARLEKAGTNMRALDFVAKLRKQESDDAAILLRDIVRYARWLGLDAVKQGNLFDASDDAGAPNERVRGELAEAQAYEEGFRAGKAGRDATDSRFPKGSPLHARFYEGWSDGQAAIVGLPPKKGRNAKATAGNRGVRTVGRGRRGRSNPEDRAGA